MHVNWRAGRQVGSYAVELKLERLPVKNRETPSQGQGIGKVKAFESQQKRDLRRATIRKAECASPKARGNFEQQSEQKRQQGIAAVASRASVAAFSVVQVWVEVRAEAPGRLGGAGS